MIQAGKLFVLVLLANGLAGCSAKRNSSTPVVPTPPAPQTYAPVDNCGDPIVATLTKIAPDSPLVGASVSWQIVNTSVCAEPLIIQLSSGPQSFVSSFTFQKTYSLPGTFNESILLTRAATSTHIKVEKQVSATVVVASAPVTPPPVVAPTCQISALPAFATVDVDPAGIPLVPPPIFQLRVTASRVSRLLSVQSRPFAGTFTPQSPLTMATSLDFQIPGALAAIGESVLVATVADPSDASLSSTCLVSVNVRAVVQPPTVPPGAEFEPLVRMAFMDGFYRLPTNSEMGSYVQLMLAGASIADVRRMMAYSDEGQRIIESLYVDILNRASEAAGKAIWSERMATSYTYVQMREGFAYSNEARIKLNALYREVLNRDIDPSGLEYFTRRLASCENRITYLDVKQALFDSAEYRRNHR